MVEKVKAIFKEFKSEPEEIGDDILIFKCVLPKKGNCETTIKEQFARWGPPGCYVAHDNDMLVGSNKLRPDVAFWMVAPTGEQKESPQNRSNRMPLPDVWVEGAYEGSDQEAAQWRLENIVIPRYLKLDQPFACLLIVIPHLRNYDSDAMAAYTQRTNHVPVATNNNIEPPQQAQIAALIATLGALANNSNEVNLTQMAAISSQITQLSYQANQLNLTLNSTPTPPLVEEPEGAPKIAYWPGGLNKQWFKVQRGLRIDIQVPGAPNNPFRFDMNWIMDALDDPLPVQAAEAPHVSPQETHLMGRSKKAKKSN
jgi:hypothetical protein